MDDRTVTTISDGGTDTRRTEPPHCTVVMWRSTVWDTRAAQGRVRMERAPAPSAAQGRREDASVTMSSSP